MGLCKRCGTVITGSVEGEYCAFCEVDIKNQPKKYKKKCRWCGDNFETIIPNKLYCSDEHKKQGRIDVNRKKSKKYYDNNKKTNILRQLGTTTISKHRNKDFEREKQIIKNELNRTKVRTVYKGKSNYAKGGIKFTSLIPKIDEIQLGTQKTHNYASFDDYVQTSISYWMNAEGSCPECESPKHLRDISRCEVACDCGLLLYGAPHPNFKYPDDNYDEIPFCRYSHENKNLKLKRGEHNESS